MGLSIKNFYLIIILQTKNLNLSSTKLTQLLCLVHDVSPDHLIPSNGVQCCLHLMHLSISVLTTPHAGYVGDLTCININCPTPGGLVEIKSPLPLLYQPRDLTTRLIYS